MMKKKTVNIGLICVVMVVWGLLIYKFTSGYLMESPLIIQSQPVSTSAVMQLRSRDTFMLKPVSRDPFLNKRHLTEQTAPPKKRYVAITRKKVELPPRPWPELTYYGFIKSSAKKGEEALITIDGQLFRLRKGQMERSILIADVYKDSVAVIFNKTKKILKVR